MSKNGWESIDDLFTETNDNSKKVTIEDDELDQNELLGIIDDEDYQYFLHTEKIGESDVDEKHEAEVTETKEVDNDKMQTTADLKSEEVEATNIEEEKIVNEEKEDTIKSTNENKEESKLDEVEADINATDSRSELSVDEELEEKKHFDEDDDEDEEQISRENFWSERSRDSMKNDSTISDSSLNISDSLNKNVDSVTKKEENIQQKSNTDKNRQLFNNKPQIPHLMQQKIMNYKPNQSQPLLPLMRPSIQPPLLDNPFLYKQSPPLLPTPLVPLMYLNTGFQQPNSTQFNDFDVLKQTMYFNNQQNFLNAPLYTDFCSQNMNNQQSMNKFPKQIEKKRKSEPPVINKNLDIKNEMLDQTKELKTRDSNANFQPPVKITKNDSVCEKAISKPDENVIKEESSLVVNKIEEKAQDISSSPPKVEKLVNEIDDDYIKKLEQQKKIREAILKKKEERRLQRALEQKKQDSCESTKVDNKNISANNLVKTETPNKENMNANVEKKVNSITPLVTNTVINPTETPKPIIPTNPDLNKSVAAPKVVKNNITTSSIDNRNQINAQSKPLIPNHPPIVNKPSLPFNQVRPMQPNQPSLAPPVCNTNTYFLQNSHQLNQQNFPIRNNLINRFTPPPAQTQNFHFMDQNSSTFDQVSYPSMVSQFDQTNQNIYSYTNYSNASSNNGIYQDPMHFYSSQQNFIRKPQTPVNRIQTPPIPIQSVPNIMKSQTRLINPTNNFMLNNQVRPNFQNKNPNEVSAIVKENNMKSSQDVPRQQQPQIVKLTSQTKAILHNLSLSTSEKCLLDLCNVIQIKDKVVNIKMVMSENRAEIVFYDRESAEKFFKQYNRLGINKKVFNYKNKMILFELIAFGSFYEL